jgi:hypothetical protein
MQRHLSAYSNLVVFDTRRIKSLIVIWLGYSLLLCQSAFSQKFGSEGDSNRLYFLNLQYTQSWVRSDTSTYNHLLWAEDFVHQNSTDGILYPKQALSSLFGKPRFEKLEYFYPENVMIQFITSEAAMVFARTRLRWVGQPTEAFSQYNDVYIKREGRWICVSANVTMLSKPGDARAVFTKLPEPTRFISYHEGKEADKNVLKELNARLAEALLRSKRELAENILADDFTLLASNGLLYKKREVLEQIRNTAKSNSTDTYSIENLSIRFVAHDVAMIHAAIVTRFKDGTVAGTQYNDIYVKREDRWVCVSANNTPIKN